MMEPWSKEWKEQRLFELYELWKACVACQLSETRQNVVFGQGNADAKIMFIGEAPGADEDATGECFCGESGNLLKALVEKAGIKWTEAYIANMVSCRPPNNRDPLTIERDACLPRLQEIIYLVDPWVIVPVGKFALKSLVKGRDWPITEHHGVVFSSPRPGAKLVGDKNGLELPGRVFPRTGDDKKKHFLEYELFPILHPAYLLREDSFDQKRKQFPTDGITHQTLSDLRRIKKYIDDLEGEYSAIPNFVRS